MRYFSHILFVPLTPRFRSPLASKRWYVPHLLGWYNIIRITYQDVIVQDGDKKVQENVPMIGKMSPSSEENVPELTPEKLDLSLEPKEMKSVKDKKKRRRQAIVSLMNKDSHISMEAIAEKLDVHERTIKRDIKELRESGVIERIDGDFGGEWKILNKKK